MRYVWMVKDNNALKSPIYGIWDTESGHWVCVESHSKAQIVDDTWYLNLLEEEMERDG